jgi:hypothetical protein
VQEGSREGQHEGAAGVQEGSRRVGMRARGRSAGGLQEGRHEGAAGVQEGSRRVGMRARQECRRAAGGLA